MKEKRAQSLNKNQVVEGNQSTKHKQTLADIKKMATFKGPIINVSSSPCKASKYQMNALSTIKPIEVTNRVNKKQFHHQTNTPSPHPHTHTHKKKDWKPKNIKERNMYMKLKLMKLQQQPTIIALTNQIHQEMKFN